MITRTGARFAGPRSYWLIALLAFSMGALAPVAAQNITYQEVFDGASFDAPVELAVAPGEEKHVYVVEQGGFGGSSRIQRVSLIEGTATPFLVLDDRVQAGGEMGLLGLAFAPDYAESGDFYVYYTAGSPRRSVLSRFQRSDASTGDPESEEVLLEVEQPASNHNAGKIAFGPDGYLYVALGDGGNQGDPQGNGQDRTTLLGSLLRIDVTTTPDEGDTYVIPPDNPFVDVTDGTRPEIFAYGFRNPWKFSFDRATGDLWLADVGQNAWEEINIVESGGNYGWNPVEGPECYIADCDLSAYQSPLFSYSHGSGPLQGYSVTGGVVYRGNESTQFEGSYLFADFALSRLWRLDQSGEEPESILVIDEISSISSINEGPDGEVYVLSYGGAIYRLVFNTVSAETEPRDSGDPLQILSANPTRSDVRIAVKAQSGGDVHLDLLDMQGRKVRALLSERMSAEHVRDVRIDTVGLASGVYVLRLVTSNGVKTKPLTILQ